MVEPDSGGGEGPAGVCAAVLAGGLGSRLRAVVTDRPKVLADVNGRPFLSYLLDQLSEAGVRRAVLCTGYGAEQVRAACGERHGALALRYSTEPDLRGTGGALRFALAVVEGDPVLALNGDSFCEVDLAAVLARHRESGARATVVLARSEDCGRYGRVETDEAQRVTRFAEKSADAGPGWINAGVYVLAREVIAAIPAGRAVSLEHEVFPGLVGGGLFGCPLAARFLDIGTAASYAEAAAFFADASARGRGGSRR